MEIVEEHTPDGKLALFLERVPPLRNHVFFITKLTFQRLESALDPEHPYYDAKATAENPKWCKVRVSFRHKFPDFVKLKELQKYAVEGGILQNMQTLKQSRLSVSKVTKKEWDFILVLGGYEDEDKVHLKNNGEKTEAGMLSGQLHATSFGAGEATSVADADSTSAAVWTGVNRTSGANNVASGDAKI